MVFALVVKTYVLFNLLRAPEFGLHHAPEFLILYFSKVRFLSNILPLLFVEYSLIVGEII